MGLIDRAIDFVRTPFDAADDAAQAQGEASATGAAKPGAYGEQGAEDQQDAVRHATWTARMRQRFRESSGSDDVARAATDLVSGAHEYIGKVQRAGRQLMGTAGPDDATGSESDAMDFNNNSVGNAIGANTSTLEEAKAAVLREIRGSQLNPSGERTGSPGLVYRR